LPPKQPHQTKERKNNVEADQLAGWPSHHATAQNMNVQMIDFLSAYGAIVDYDTCTIIKS
jgi:hypothetical protein